ncbi:hypothetical protein AOL_s00054g458 [Orbilia oligospora ATCC 24927]|uniref:Anaphase spindle elongation protein 1 n=1 Tax=Arthrobotrys oligospora (strain ATCC 24927 / CBS 115.81 / DSM 1491) TaxID=756982 RepID=G1X6G4_ARTOA|nr:hypothetical protein AOL_s00054g458 [Orbilia oligospora ATCC 24927]EGX51388.1 hypothetical protein AOL_s00054g458 [Orbilia oligospora ATCC 24927]
MDNSYLTSQVTSAIESLHGIFDEIGVPHHDRESKEAALFAALSETLQSHLRLVNAEKNALVEEANKLISGIRQIHRAMDDGASANMYDDLVVTIPLRVCVETLKNKHNMLRSQYDQEFEGIKKLVQALQSYVCKLEDGFLRLQLPNLTNPTYTFKITGASKKKLEVEFARVYEEFTRRIATVKTLSAEIVNLWADLGTPSHLLDRKIVDACRENYDGFDIKLDAITALRSKKQKLVDERTIRERKINDIHQQLQPLWEKFQQDDQEEDRFLQQNRGFSLSVIQNWENELERLLEVKKEHMHIFISDARTTLQEMWDVLYYTEDEMYDFTAAWSSSNTEAVLRSHEMEIARLQKIIDERSPILSLVERYQTLVNDKASLDASSQDPSRLLAKGPRDPTRLLREEKTRKKIAKELPKIESDLVVALEGWEAEHGEPFIVLGEPFLHTILEKQRPNSKTQQSAASVLRSTAGPRAATPKVAATPKPAPARPNSAAGLRSAARTPVASSKAPPSRAATKSPTPYNRQPLSNLARNLQGSPERKPPVPARSTTPATLGRRSNNPTKTPSSAGGSIRRMPAYMAQQAAQTSANSVRHPPPRMKSFDLLTKENVPPHPQIHSVARNIMAHIPSDMSTASTICSPLENMMARRGDSFDRMGFIQESKEIKHAVSYDDMNRVPSLTSQASTLASVGSGVSSENWETYGDDSDYEQDVSKHYFDKLKAVKDRRNLDNFSLHSRKVRGIVPGVREVSQDDDWEDEAY